MRGHRVFSSIAASLVFVGLAYAAFPSLLEGKFWFVTAGVSLFILLLNTGIHVRSIEEPAEVFVLKKKQRR